MRRDSVKSNQPTFMEYQFIQIPAKKPTVQMSMGHEAIGHWLNEEVDSLPTLLTSIDSALCRISSSAETWHQPGREYSIWINNSEVLVQANSLNLPTEILEEGISFYDSEQRAECGLDDFLALIRAYQAFSESYPT